jgi:hypothetical protein
MKNQRILPVLLLALLWAGYASGETPADALDALHRAGENADPAAFISLLTSDAVVLGLPGNAHLSGKSLRDYIGASFPGGEAWNYRGAQREIRYSADGAVAWFDEALAHDHLARGWGSGVLVRTGAGWRVAQYSLNLCADSSRPPSAAAGAQQGPGTQTETAAAEADEPGVAAPEKKRECRKIRHKTNKASSC